ncbi:ribonuclease H-like domain-containing protein [Tanacetum coccineum]
MNHPRPISNAYKKGYSQVTRPFNKYSANKNSIFNKKVNTVRVKDTTARDRAVVSENKEKGVNAVKASACWGNPQQKEYKEKGVIDSGCSRHMTGNKCYLTEYEDYDGGFVSFGDGKGRISGKGKIKTGTLDFNNVYFCKELKYNLFAEVPRKDNIYSVDLKSVVPTKGLTCLFAKATIDESNLWHRRLGHINFKNMNKLVRGNLVRGNQTNGIAGTRDNIVTGQAKKKTEPEQEYILIPICTTDPLISQDPKVSEEDAEEKPTEMDESGASDKDGEDDQATRSEFERLLQQEKQTENPNSTNSINTVSTPVSTARPSCTDDDPSSPVNTAEASNAFEEHLFERFSPFKNAFTLPPVSNVTPMDDTGIFGNAYDDEDVGAEADLNNLETTMNVSPIPTTRIDKHYLRGDETVYREWEDRMERAATTASSLDAEQDSGSGPKCQDTILGGADAQTRFETASKQSNDPPLSRDYTLGSGEDSMKLLELMELCIKLSDLATAKAKTINGERQIQALVDKKKVIITESSIRSDLHLEDVGGTDCLPTATIFEELARMGAKTTALNEFSSTMASAIICLATNQKFNMSKYIFDAMIPITIQPSTSKPQKKQSRRKQKKTTAVPHPSDSTAIVPNEESVPTHSNDPLLSGTDRLKLTDLMDICTKLSERVLDLEHTKTAQAQEITNLKLRVKKLEKKAGLRTHKFKRLYKGRSIEDIDKDAKVSLVDETQERLDDVEMFDTDALIGNEVFAKNDMIEKDQDVIPKEVSTAAPSTTAVPPPDITEVEITLAQTLAKLKSAKSKVVIQEPVQSTATTAKAKDITFRDAGESTTRTPT